MSDGIVCDGFIYKYLWDDLARSLSVAHWNYRGHGRSARPVDPELIDVAAHARDLDTVRRHLTDPPVVLIGHSMGTQVSLEAYRLRREGIRALVLLCGSFGRVTHTFHGTDLLANVLPNLIEFVQRHPRLARGLWSRVPARAALKVAIMTGEIDAKSIQIEDLEPYFQHVAHVDFAMFLRMLSYAGEHSAQDLLAHIDVPVLIIAGERDSFTPPYIAEAMAKEIPDAELFIIEGGTHVAPLEHKDLVRERIERFLAARGVI
jgi:pimeloyl-ACP methyl ester carboxylesterase